MATFHYRVRGTGEIALNPRGPAGPWLEIEAPSFDEARRVLAEVSHETGYVYELRAENEEG